MRQLLVERAQSEAPDQIHELGVDDLLRQLLDLSTKLSSALRPQAPVDIDQLARFRLAGAILAFRRLRDRLFGADLFGEPAWDILLELYAAEGSGRRLSISGACYISGVPPSTALRWIARLEQDDWIRRVDDPSDRRRSWLALTERTERKMHDLLNRMAILPTAAAAFPPPGALPEAD